ncbi:GNAT family N-acetyltransferase [Mycobacterium sp. E740]|uniref:GNAT family N-acetyltransferase n=1 Tax=Mycobacterium sp. E740 TaxID=1834149 RepID=UPI0007FB9BE4|nr:GNAT family N-acetyltransferase [Mycobacterium sp. E740]OBI72798.1 acetyltransferase [Mycobacterium sp. E740]
MAIDVTLAAEADLTELADVAARTFPLACPPSSTPDDIAAFVEENLSEARFREYLADPDRAVLVARDASILGYAMVIRGEPDDPDVQRAVELRPAVEVSKLYVSPDSHGAGVSAALMIAAVQQAEQFGARAVWLGVNQQNHRAQRFYAKHGFSVTGTKTFQLGEAMENDYVMVRTV